MTHEMSKSVVPQESSWQSSSSLLQECLDKKIQKVSWQIYHFSFFLKVLFLDLLAPVLHGKGCINMVPVWGFWTGDKISIIFGTENMSQICQIHIWLKDMFDGFFLSPGYMENEVNVRWFFFAQWSLQGHIGYIRIYCGFYVLNITIYSGCSH